MDQEEPTRDYDSKDPSKNPAATAASLSFQQTMDATVPRDLVRQGQDAEADL